MYTLSSLQCPTPLYFHAILKKNEMNENRIDLETTECFCFRKGKKKDAFRCNII